MSTQEDSRFGDKQFNAASAEPGGIAWRDGTSPAVVVAVTKAEEGDDVAVTIAPLAVETVHANDLASEYVDPAGDGAMPATAAPPTGPAAAAVPVAAVQPPADDGPRQTTPTGAAIGAGTAVGPAGAAIAGGQDVDARLAEVERREAELEAREQRIEDAEAAEAAANTTPPPPAS